MHTTNILGTLKPKANNIEWIDGPLVEGIKKNYIIVISKLEAAGPELVEKLNMLLDDARSITLPAESGIQKPITLQKDAMVIGIKYYRTNKNQNTISRAFRNRFTAFALKSIENFESLEQIISESLLAEKDSRIPPILAFIHQNIVNYSKEKIIGKNRSENYIFGLKNLMRMLDYIKKFNQDENPSILILNAFFYAYLNEISDSSERSMILEEIKKILNNDRSLEFLNEIKNLKKKAINEEAYLKNNRMIDLIPDEHWRPPNTGKASWEREYKELKEGIDINTPETGGTTKKDAWYGADTRGNYGVGEPGHGGGAWGYRTEELYQQFLKKRKGLNNYNLGIPLKTFQVTFGKEIDSLILQLNHLFDPEHFIHRRNDEKGSRVNIKKFLSFQSGRGNSKIFDKTSFEREFKSLKEIDILFLINKGRRIFHFEYSVSILVAMMSVTEILLNHQIPFAVLGYSDFENYKKKINLTWYKTFEEENYFEIEKNIYYGISNQWSGDTVNESSLIKEVKGFFFNKCEIKNYSNDFRFSGYTFANSFRKRVKIP